MRESVIYQDILQQGLQQGRREGKQEGEVDLITRQLTRRLGEVDSLLMERIRELYQIRVVYPLFGKPATL